jgi:hypothetical protein
MYSNEAKVEYSIKIHNPYDSEEKVFITGQTDEAIYYRETCLFPWEDNDLSLVKFTEGNFAQIFSQANYFSRKFKGHFFVEPPIYFGVLTNGLVWSFVCRFYVEGHVLLRYTKEITLGAHENNFQLVAAALVACFINCQRLRDVIDTQSKVLSSMVSSMVSSM